MHVINKICNHFSFEFAVPVPGTWISKCGKYALFPMNVVKLRYAILAKFILPNEENFVEFNIHRVLLKGKAGDY